MRSLSLDLETYSSVSLAKCGVYKYAESPDFEILLFACSVDGGEVKVIDLACGEKIPEEVLEALTDDSVIKWAFNAQFERVCLSRCLGLAQGEYLDPHSWRCSMVWSAYMGLPLSLEGAGAVLGLEKQKLTEGKDLIRYFCVPCRATRSNGGRTRNLPEHDEDKWIRFKAYNKRDVETEMQIQKKLARFPVPEEIWEEYHLDQEINDRGIRIDSPFVRETLRIDDLTNRKLTERMKELTGLGNPNSVVQLKGWLEEKGVATESLDKKAVSKLIQDTDGTVKEVLLLRQQLAKSSVKKYQAMENAACTDGRCRGMFQFYGANRTGRFAGRLVQLQNLPQNRMEDLAQARALVRAGDTEALELLYDDIPDTLSQLIRTAFIPAEGKKFYVADFSAIEARVIAWLAGEKWRSEVFRSGGDIYCMSASQMFGVPVEKHGVNGHLRQKGKVAELACIAENSLVLTDQGLIPIQDVTTNQRIWDGENWVCHDGVICRGEREVMTYEGLTATSDHLVWVQGQSQPVQFGFAAASGAHLIQTGDGRRAIRMGEDSQPGEKMEFGMESLLCPDAVPGMRIRAMAAAGQLKNRKVQGVSVLLEAKEDPEMAGSKAHSCEAKMRKSKRSGIPQLWGKRNHLRFSKRNGSGIISYRNFRNAGQENGSRQDRHQRELYSGEYEVHKQGRKSGKPEEYSVESIRADVLAVCAERCSQKTVIRDVERSDNRGGGNSCCRKEKELETHRSKARVYDIRNAGRHHRFTVSGRLVHNCGYGGSTGALKAMGALEMGLAEEELQPLVDAWRSTNPNIVRLWWDVDRAVKKTVKEKTSRKVRGIRFTCRSGMLFITLPSGRNLAYVKPCMGENRFGGESVTYEGVGSTKKWERIESYGPKFVENIVQAISRDILMYAMKTLRHCSIVGHVHDEIIIEADPAMSLDAICEQMGRTPTWAEGLILQADGYTCNFYMKD